MGVVSLFVLFLNFYLISCTYTPGGDDVQAGSVLLPATRRGRYLANIVRRQAVDGTGIKFNKDADRINAESKKKVDVLSEELLPYIIAEQERRTTLYKRIMTAIQNGEKGVTIAEIRNKPPLLVRKGFLYRCPSNRAPKEPDGSGSLMCEDDIVPTQVMYDSCLSAEDKELYVAENKYFFCNRHRVEGPDLPRNGTTVIGCAPIERTSLNYTTRKCALEDSDDVVVHYRYYPDRSYKYVTELDPDREVCEHWNPCQVGYIYSLPSPDQAQLASELWKEDEDSPNEYVPLSSGNYTSSPRRVDIPSGYMFDGVVLVNPVTGDKTALPPENFVSALDPSGNFTMVTVKLGKWSSEFAGEYQAQLKPKDSRRCLLLGFLFVSFMKLICSLISMSFVGVDILLGQMKKKVEIPFKCNECRVINIMIRCRDKNYYNVDPSKYVIKKGSGEMVIIIEIDGSSLTAFGDYFCVVKNENGVDENIKIVTVNGIQLTTIVESVRVGGYFDRNLDYICGNCTLKDIVCNGESVMSSERISSIASSRMINFNFPRFEPSNACVYVGLFKDMDKHVKKNLAVLDTVQIKNRNLNVPVPKTGEMFEVAIRYTCSGCIVEKVLVNGIPLDTIPADNGPQALYHSTSSELVIRITEFSESYEGAYQAIFNVKGKTVVKTVMIIRDDADEATTVQTTSDHPIGPTDIGPKKALVWSVEKSADGTEPSDGTEPVSGETTAESTAENTVVTGDSTGENTGETTVEPSRA